MESKKRIYIGLLIVSLTAVTILIPLILFLLRQNTQFSKVMLIIIATILGGLFLLLGLGILAIIIMIVRSKTIPSLDNITKLANELLFPLTLVIGKVLGIKSEKIRSSYIAVNNYLVKSKHIILNGERVMILLPHCLQNNECPHKITMDINNCKQCGKCCVSDLVKLSQKYSAIIKVATGGTLARKLIKECRPSGVIAVACERDLSMGIQDSGALPVFGVLNCRPNGPCFNTSVDIDKVEQALIMICKGG
ncbi:MAG: hypothetical protein H6Q64_184 [Firmicutes bacterium]|nr:hypothetical protein [Bacillota bacterium]